MSILTKETMTETRDEWVIAGIPLSVLKIVFQVLLIILLAATAFNLGGVFAMENLAYSSSCGNYNSASINNISSGNWVYENKTVGVR
jgi:hypothetical protein